uniref:C2H2-type domain-containing protein n=1 Tax=Petromyzon marinus TaxID=7757 RepID=S4REU3_PETMA
EKRHRCELCGKTYSLAFNLKRHTYVHTGAWPCRCKVCGHGVLRASSNGLRLHQRKHAGDKKYCALKNCFGYNCSCRIKLHVYNVVYAKEKPLTQQQRLFALSDPIRRSVSANHSQKPFADESETYGFQLEKSDLERPRLESTGEKPYRCEVCGRGFPQSSSHVKTHQRKHMGDTGFNCQVLGRRAERDLNLQFRRRPHAGNKTHRCELCGKSYSKPYGLKQHMRIHTGEKLHRCEVCRHPFLQLSSLKIHLRTHT